MNLIKIEKKQRKEKKPKMNMSWTELLDNPTGNTTCQWKEYGTTVLKKLIEDNGVETPKSDAFVTYLCRVHDGPPFLQDEECDTTNVGIIRFCAGHKETLHNLQDFFKEYYEKFEDDFYDTFF